MKIFVTFLAVVVALVAAVPQDGYGYQAPLAPAPSGPGPRYTGPSASGPRYSGPGPQYNAAPAQYAFRYDVDDAPSGNFYGHQEERDGVLTRGSYYVRLPDTRLMRVDYYADETGYHPTITYEGEAQFPSVYHSASAPARAYTAPSNPGRVFVPAPAPLREYSPPAPLAPTPADLYSVPGK